MDELKILLEEFYNQDTGVRFGQYWMYKNVTNEHTCVRELREFYDKLWNEVDVDNCVEMITQLLNDYQR